MNKFFTFFSVLLLASLCYSQQKVTDVSPDGKFTNTYELQNSPGKILINTQEIPFGTTPTWQAKRDRQVGGLAFGDYDNDGDLDLAVGCYYSNSYPPINDYENMIFRNNNGVLDTIPAWISSDERTTGDIKWADVNKDGLPDLLSANGNFAKSVLYLNSPMGLSTSPSWISNDAVWTVGANFCDIDGDGDLDLALANQGLGDIPNKPIEIFYNNNGTLSTSPDWLSADYMITNTVAFADINNSSIVVDTVTYTASGSAYSFVLPLIPIYKVNSVKINSSAYNNYSIDDVNGWISLGTKPPAGSQVEIIYSYMSKGDMAACKWVYFNSGIYFNNNGTINGGPTWNTQDNGGRKGMAWADMDNDGYMDLALGGSSGSANVVYKNDAGVMSNGYIWASNSTNNGVQDLIWGDVNKDGYPDLAVVHFGQTRTEIFLNRNGVLDATPTWSYSPGVSSTAIAFGDVNGDGWLDLAIGTARNPVMLFMADPSLVPVELSSFRADADNDNILLNWSTATEKNNQGFEVERKLNGIWEKVGFVAGNGTTSEKHNYSFLDQNVKTNKYSYRLKQIDFDGSYSYSQEVEIDFTNGFDFTLEQNYPNPFNPSTLIKFNVPQNGNVKLIVTNAVGQEIETLFNGFMEAGNHSQTFDAQNLTSGVYFYTLTTNSGSISKKMMLIK